MGRLVRFPVIGLSMALIAMGYLVIGGGAHAAGKSTAAMKGLIKAAGKEGEVNILVGGFTDAKFLRDIENAMKAKYGAAIRITGTGGPSMSRMVKRLVQERRAKKTPSSDLMYASPRQRLRLQQAGATDSVDWVKYDPTISPKEISRTGSGVVSFADRVGIVYNTKSISPDMVPRTLEDLTHPKYKGKLATTPYGTGWGEAAMLFGADSVRKIAKGMNANIAGFTGSSKFGPIITGEFPIFAFTGSSSQALQQKEKGAPIDVAYPFQAYFLYSIEMLKGSPHPNASRLFALFLRTPKGQEILWKHRKQDSPFLKTSKVYKQVQKARAAGQKVLLYTEDDVLKHRDVFKKLVPSINKMFRKR